MIEIILYGRGGQGSVTASQILAIAAFWEGKYAQAFPSFGPERRGAPVTAYVRVNGKAIVDRSPVLAADYVIVLDPNLFKMSNPMIVLKETGYAILNSDKVSEEILHQISKSQIRIFCIDATTISEEIYGKTSIPITNIAMLGAFASVSRVVHLDSILDVVDQFFLGDRAEKAKRSAQDAYARMEQIRSQ